MHYAGYNVLQEAVTGLIECWKSKIDPLCQMRKRPFLFQLIANTSLYKVKQISHETDAH